MNCVDFLLKDQFSREANFILGRSEELSFAALSQRVAKVSAWINDNIGKGRKVLLLAPNSSFFVVNYLAIMKSGNVAVPLNPAIEAKQYDYIKEQCESTCVFMSAQVKKRLNLIDESVWDESSYEAILSQDIEVDFELSDFDSEQLAQIIYTSGSTSLPKGVMLSHKNIIANTDSIIDYLKLTENDVMEVVLPFFYCYGLSLLHTHLKIGASIVLNNTFIFLGSVLSDLEKYKCTGFAGVPSHFQILLRKSDSFKNTNFPNLRYVTQAGGKLHTAFIKEFCESKPEVEFYVMYGQTEATARLSYLPPMDLENKFGSIGKGIPGVELKVVNDAGELVKPNEIGEIVAKGDNVMEGYFKDEIETNSAIRNNWLYTGDLATVDEDGYIYHAARRKEIIKVGGKRVSPKEIEEVIVGISGVIDCTIEAIDDDLLGEAIKAIVVINKDREDITEKYIQEYCSDHLENYKIPHVIEFSSKVDVNAAGKKVSKH
ncbi:class I adenylate-forming enzyme family protein [Carboxylicivirga sp. N1Y90]|uniref:class I adenylate-forming enzyme family protein n=1 Tax=Carboxylicivirga fragile TaxID=3417571 RepID=UPI003D3308E2|nr:AMP-binding protein [Marinilabiliaceae bacterium N1Y90]